ncbi:MAG: zinc metalloprotease [Bacteroidota bacterium]
MKKMFAFIATSLILLNSCKKQDVELAITEQGETEMVGSRQCASHEVLERQIAADPSRGKFLDDLEMKIQAFKKRNIAGRDAGVLNVPVVINIVLPDPSIVSTEQINSQIAVLTKDFSKTNSELSNSGVYLAGYPLANVANCQINFVVASVTRTVKTGTFGTNDAVKKATSGKAPTNPTTQLNIWVCDLSSGLLGYAQFPGGLSATDGVVIDYQAFGTSASYTMYANFNLGRTATHEIGHWFNLRHIWGDTRCGNDQVGDTPAHDASNGGCPSTSLVSRCTGKPKEQWMNYMDYTDDRCMYMFTAGQKTRMDACIDAARSAYTY